MTVDYWDRPGFPWRIRQNFRKVLDCGTGRLGYKRFASDIEDLLVPCTCKGRMCISCGVRATMDWQRAWWCVLPDVPFVGITLTMPDYLWGAFKTHSKLRRDLPALGAAVVESWTRAHHPVRRYIMIIEQNFSSRLNFDPHLHILVSVGGLDELTGQWQAEVGFNDKFSAVTEIMELWRFAVTQYLEEALSRNLLKPNLLSRRFLPLLNWQKNRPWQIDISNLRDKRQLLEYIGRYIRRPPISKRRILKVSKEEVVFTYKDKRLKKEGIAHVTPVEQVPEYYAHGTRQFDLCSPRSMNNTCAMVHDLLGQRIRMRPQRLPWAAARRKYFQKDPLIDSKGNRMHSAEWIGPSRQIRLPESAIAAAGIETCETTRR
jgi:hypothetical protein